LPFRGWADAVRDYAKVAPTFWTGETGRALRQLGRDSQLLALFLITNPNANMIGLYHLPLPTVAHYLGWAPEGALKGLRRVSEGGFCRYDESREEVWVPEMAAHQLGATLTPRDNRHKAVVREWNSFRKSPFYLDFHRRYGDAYCLPAPSPLEAPSKGGSAKPLRSQEQEQEQEQDSLSAADAAAGEGSPNAPPQPTAPEGHGTGKPPKKPRHRDELFDAVVEVTGCDARASASYVGRVCSSLRSADPPYTPAEVRSLPGVLQARGFSLPLTPGTVEKYAGWSRHPPSPGQTPPETDLERAARIRREREEDAREREAARNGPSIRDPRPQDPGEVSP
jgi:hypothetical protein